MFWGLSHGKKRGIKREKEGIASFGGWSASTPSPMHHLVRPIQTRSDSAALRQAAITSLFLLRIAHPALFMEARKGGAMLGL